VYDAGVSALRRRLPLPIAPIVQSAPARSNAIFVPSGDHDGALSTCEQRVGRSRGRDDTAVIRSPPVSRVDRLAGVAVLAVLRPQPAKATRVPSGDHAGSGYDSFGIDLVGQPSAATILSVTSPRMRCPNTSLRQGDHDGRVKGRALLARPFAGTAGTSTFARRTFSPGCHRVGAPATGGMHRS
jgi:hypothetical protein